MENVEDVEADKILTAAGVEKVSTLSRDEKRTLMDALNESKQETYNSSSVSDTREENPAVFSEDEKEELHRSVLSGHSLFDKITFDSKSSNHANTNHSVGEKEMSKLSASKSINYATAVTGHSSKGGSGRPQKPENKPAPGAAVPVRDTEPNLNNSYQANQSQSNDGVWLQAGGKSKENGVPSRRSLSPPKEEAKREELENIEANDNSSPDNSKDRDSPEILEEVLKPLMELAFEKRNTTSLFSGHSLPPLSIPRDEWISQVAEYFFAKKAARIRAENSQTKWVTLSERNLHLNYLENAVRWSPSRTKDDGASSFTENRMDIENSPKARTSPDNIGDNARESSPDVAFVENSPKRDTINSDAGDNIESGYFHPRQDGAVIACSSGKPVNTAVATSSKRYAKTDTPQNSPTGRNMEDSGFPENDQFKRRSARRKQKNKNNRGGMQRSGSTGLNDDNSNGGPNSPSTVKNNENEYSHNNADCPPIAGSIGSPNIDNNKDEQMECPMCQTHFSKDVIQNHAWNCVGKEVMEQEQVADRGENGERSDDTDVEQNKLFSNEIEDSTDDEDFVVTKPKASTTRKRNIFFSEDDIPRKTSRK